MASKEEQNRNFKNLGIFIFLMVLLPGFIGYLATGFDTAEIREIFVNYGVFGLGGALIALIYLFIEENIKEGDSKYGNSVFVHSPGDPPSIPFFKFFKERPFGFIFLFGLFFGLLALVLNLQGQTFTGEVLTEQQFSPTSKTIFLSFIVPSAENIFATAFAIVFISMILRPLARKNKWSSGQFRVISIMSIVLLFGLVWVGNHQLRYGSTDLAIISVFIFGSLGGLLTVITGSIWPFFMMHMTNNLFFTLNSQLSSDGVRVFILLFLAIQGVGLYFSVRKKKKNA